MTIKEFIHAEYQKAYDQTKPGNIYPAYPSEYLFPLIQEYVRIKCLEAIKNVKHKTVDLMIEFDMEHDVYIELYNSIQNIPNQDVMPEL